MITALQARYPALGVLVSNAKNNWKYGSCKCKVIEFYDEEREPLVREIKSLEDLWVYFAHAYQPKCRHRHYIIKDLSTEYIDTFDSKF
jgi:hypothetical protein